MPAEKVVLFCTLSQPKPYSPNMKTTIRKTGRAPLYPLIALLIQMPAHAADLWEMSLADLGRIRATSIASGTDTPLDKAAAIATVITADDIEAMGATDIDQVLETVPGLHVGRSDQAYTSKFYIRGITSTYNPQTLFLINGLPVSSLFIGNRSNIWAGMPVKAVARIEVIRGPGSALYGADAFAGVINVITKTRNDLGGTSVGARIGSFDTQSLWLEHGSSLHGVETAFVLEAESTDGWRKTIEADRQTLYDQLTGTHASHAPGPVSTMKRMIDARLDVAHDHSRLRAGYQGRFKVGSGPGYLEALDPDGRIASERFNLDYTWKHDDLTPDWGVEARLSYYQSTQEIERNLKLLPDGATLPGIGSSFPDGFIGNPGHREENTRLDFSALFKGFANRYLRLGAGLYRGNMFEVTETKNFTPGYSPRPGGLEDVSDTAEVYLPEKSRLNRYVFAQDEWKLARNWGLTTGIRYDLFSDFGNTTNPRMALVWAASDKITTRLLYGRAFRAPTIAELFVTSNPITLGNPGLKPETIDSWELAFSHKLSPMLMYTANVYRYHIEDFITFVPSGLVIQAQNVGVRDGHGLELEADYNPLFNLRFVANYAWQRSIDRTTHSDVGEAPGQQVYVRSEWLFRPDWQLDAQLTWVGPQKRAAGDSRGALGSYTAVDVTLNKREIVQGLDVALSLRNLLDADIREPSPGPVAPLPVPAIPSDFPMAGRSLYAGLNYRF